MLLSRESPRTCWSIMLATWLVCAALILLHTAAVRDYVTLLDAQGQRGAAEASTPLRQVLPAGHADAQMWVRHALAAAESGEARVRFTTADNAPPGREVHWSSSLVWLLRGASTAQSALTGQTGAHALERTLLWLNAPLFIGLLVLLSAWAAVRAGAGAGVVIALGMVGHNRFYEGFAPANVDHHGLINVALLGLWLGLVFMGAGWWQPTASGRAHVLPASREQARGGAIVSAFCGAAGLWLSTATVAPAIALAGISSLALVGWRGKTAARAGARFDPSLWRLWGRIGAAVSFVFYFLEYAPAHFRLRLEVNHPLYSLAWWGGAEIVALLGTWLLARAEIAAHPLTHEKMARAPALRLPVWRLTGAFVAVCAAPLAVLLGGREVFLVLDPFVGGLRHYVAEGMSLPMVVSRFGLRYAAYDLTSILLLVPAVIGLWRRRADDGILLGVLTWVTAALVTMACLETRWWLMASTAQIVLVLGMLAVGAGATSPRRRWRWILLTAGVIFLLPKTVHILSEISENRRRAVSPGDLIQPLYRDLAATLRRNQPAGEIVLLASPNASAGIGYFGRFASLGTLYWENAAGLRAAAEIFSAATDDEAATLIRTRRVTHVAFLSKVNFIGEYFQLLHPHAPLEDGRKSFGYRLGAKLPLPRWLQPIPYRPPPELKEASPIVRLFKVAFDQTDAEHLYHTAVAHTAEGDLPAAEQTLAAAALRTPAAEHPVLFEAAGSAFYDFGADALAVRTLRRVPGTEVTLAWILATTRDDSLRDGRAALALVEPIVRTVPNDPTVLSALAAAYAELGRWPEAKAAAERALAAADAGSAKLLTDRLATYRSGKPWRQ